MSCIQDLKSNLKNNVKSLCSLLPSSEDNVYRCCQGSYIVKLFNHTDADDNKIRKELSIYDRLAQTQFREYFSDKPELFTDDQGKALIYETSPDIFTLYYLIFDSRPENVECKKFVYFVVEKVVAMLEELNRNGIYHGDIHDGNVIFNCKTKKVQFIDVESVKILPFDDVNAKSTQKQITSDVEMIEYYKNKLASLDQKLRKHGVDD